MRAAVVYKTDNLLERVTGLLKSMGIECETYTTPSAELEKFDFIISVGGDGTILRILQKIKHCPPIFGINTGRVGLLTHSGPENFETELKNCVERFEIEEFPRIRCRGRDKLLALNEIAIVSRKPSKLIDVTVTVDGEEIDSLRCDGYIVSTQIGSTGYAFSAGGPVVEPYLDCLILIPIAPFRFGWKPYLLRINRRVEIEAENAVVVADGQSSFELEGKVVIERSDWPARFFKKRGRFRRLFEKVKSIG